MITLGEKIKFYRKRVALSQLDVEVSTNMSIGSLSRIESNEINPTKETVFKIADYLKLNQKDLSNLLGINDFDVSEEAILNAISQLEEYFSREDVLAMLLDCYWNVVNVSNGFFKLFPSLIQHKAILPVNLLEILFNTELKTSLGLNFDNLDSFGVDEVAHYRLSMGYRITDSHTQEMLARLNRNKDFQRVWDASQDISEPYLNNDNRKIKLSVEGIKYTLGTTYRYLNFDPRFEILDYFPLS